MKRSLSLLLALALLCAVYYKYRVHRPRCGGALLIRPVLGQGHRKGNGGSVELLLHFGYFECSAVYGKLIVAYLAAIAGNAFCPRVYQYVAF